MNPSTKKLCIFGLATGVANMLVEQSTDERVKWRAQVLAKAGQLAVDKCNIKVDKSKLKQVQVKIDEVCKDKSEFDTVDMLSFLLLGLDDLQANCKDTSIINVMIKRTNWLIQYFDPKLENVDMFDRVLKRYLAW